MCRNILCGDSVSGSCIDPIFSSRRQPRFGLASCKLRRTVLKLHNIRLAVSHHSRSWGVLAISHVHLSDQWNREQCLQFVFLPEDFCGTLADDDAGSQGVATLPSRDHCTDTVISEPDAAVNCWSGCTTAALAIFTGKRPVALAWKVRVATTP